MRLFLIILIALSVGCSAPSQLRKLVFGTSLKDFDTAQKKYTKTVTMKPGDCFKRVYDILKNKNVVIYKSDTKHNFISAFGFTDYFKPKSDEAGVNTTEVGILFKEVSEGKTEIVIISDDYNLAKFVADDLFKALESK